MFRTTRGIALSFFCLLLSSTFAFGADRSATEEPLVVVVMDPLAAPLACDCVQGYAQRKYEYLGEFLQDRLRCKVEVLWAESLPAVLKERAGKHVDLVIGKESVIRSDAKKAHIKVAPVARLTDKLGATTQTGLLVVRSGDPALAVSDLKGYRILFGPKDCDEKSAAAERLLTVSGIKLPTKMERYAACSVAATKLIELGDSVNAAAVISSYARPLLEGCGTIEAGELRVIGVTEPVPFITVFASADLPARRRKALLAGLLAVKENPELLRALESQSGFVAVKRPARKKKAN